MQGPMKGEKRYVCGVTPIVNVLELLLGKSTHLLIMRGG